MKRLLILFFSIIYIGYCNAQVIVSDSAETGPESNLMTFYSLATGQKTVVSNTDWHLAVSIRPTQFPNAPLGGTTIRFNQTLGMTVYFAPNAIAADFNTLDTTGYRSWPKQNDNDADIDEGAFNLNRTGIFDFGWGKYNSSTHDVSGDSIYLIQLPNGQLKKFLVVNLDRDTAYNIRYSNIDNSDLQNVHISKAAYAGKSFVYFNLIDNTVKDKEPLRTSWDLQFLKYAATDVSPGKITPVVGVWLNKGDSAAERRNQNVAGNDYSGLNFSGKLNAIGWNWKHTGAYNALLTGKNITEFLQFYVTDDSLAYFVKTAAGDVYKVVFTRYRLNNGRINFYTQKMGSVTGIDEQTEVAALLGIYPNPANSEINVALNTDNALLRVFDISGRMITELNATQNKVQLNTSDFSNGVYLLQVTANSRTWVNKFVVSH